MNRCRSAKPQSNGVLVIRGLKTIRATKVSGGNYSSFKGEEVYLCYTKYTIRGLL